MQNSSSRDREYQTIWFINSHCSWFLTPTFLTFRVKPSDCCERFSTCATNLLQVCTRESTQSVACSEAIKVFLWKEFFQINDNKSDLNDQEERSFQDIPLFSSELIYISEVMLCNLSLMFNRPDGESCNADKKARTN